MDKFQCPRNSDIGSCTGCDRAIEEAASDALPSVNGRRGVLVEQIRHEAAVVMELAFPVKYVGGEEPELNCDTRRKVAASVGADIAKYLQHD